MRARVRAGVRAECTNPVLLTVVSACVQMFMICGKNKPHVVDRSVGVVRACVHACVRNAQTPFAPCLRLPARDCRPEGAPQGVLISSARFRAAPGETWRARIAAGFMAVLIK